MGIFPHAQNHSRRAISEKSVFLAQELAVRVRQIVSVHEMRSYTLLAGLAYVMVRL